MEKSRTMMVIIIALLVLLLATVVVVTLYLIRTFGGSSDPDAPVITPPPLLDPAKIEWRDIEEIRVNLQDPPQGRNSVYVVTPFIIGVNTDVPSRELNALNEVYSATLARSIINEVVFAATHAEAITPEGREAIMERILSRLQMEFGPLIVRVRATNWMVS